MTDQEQFDRGCETIKGTLISIRLTREARQLASDDITRALLESAEKHGNRAVGSLGAGLINLGKRMGKTPQEVMSIIEALEAEAETEPTPDIKDGDDA